MTNRNAPGYKEKTIPLKMTKKEHTLIKKEAADRGWSMTKMILEAIRRYLNR